jgi:large subunit ribosomal protein L2
MLIKSLIFGLKNSSGRNNSGKITVYHRGSGVKNKYKLIDFRMNLNLKYSFSVIDLVYDPIRTANLALILYSNGTLAYVLGTTSLEKNQKFDKISSIFCNIPGSLCFLFSIPKGTLIHNIITPDLKSQYVKSAGTAAVVLGIYNENFMLIKMPSKEYRIFHNKSYAVIGNVSNINHRFINYQKASINRFLNKRPIVRGVAMNPVDHPHGGGEGKSSGGRHPVTPWGRLTKGGVKTRKKKKKSVVIIKSSKII